MPELNGKIALITGAAKGIGLATAQAFVQAGARVSVLARTDDDVPALRAALGPEALVTAGDVSDEETVRRLVDTTLSTLTGIDVIVNNAAILTAKNPLTAVQKVDWDRSMEVNLRGPFLVMKHALPAMTRRKKGLIINVSSGAGRRAAPGWGPYAVSKAALEALTRLAAAEIADSGVAALTIDPGGTRTRMRAAAYPGEDPTTLPSPADVAGFILSIARRAGDPALNGAALSYREWRETVR